MDYGNLKFFSYILICLLMSCYSCLVNLVLFLFKCEMLFYVFDYFGVGKVFNVFGLGVYKVCVWCEI